MWGPPLWGAYYEDAPVPIRSLGFEEVVYADDLNMFKLFPRSCADEDIYGEIAECQSQLHAWGRANQVEFDPSKEHMAILDLSSPSGNALKLLGIVFDTKLQMGEAVGNCVHEASWRLRTVLQTRRFFSTRDLIIHYKTHILSYIEYRTPGISHAATTVLAPLDRLQENFINQLGVSQYEAFVHFNLAPLSVRRDIAMLGVIHRTLLRHGPTHFCKWIFVDRSVPHLLRRRHRRHLFDWCSGRRPNIVDRSLLGYIRIYNLLPPGLVEHASCSFFQRGLQNWAKELAQSGFVNWICLFSPRVPASSHPLRST